MSWLPSNDPILGDAKTCDALELVIVPRVRDLGGFEVRRALPHGKRQMVGPFIFFDQMGPAQFISGRGMDVRPHPHIGLATVTYLFDGRIMHRDSEGHAQEIAPGAMNLMTAGRGIAHSERTPDVPRQTGQTILGIQSWIALPVAREDVAPTFQHFDADALPVVAEIGVTARIIAGSAFGARAPVEGLSEWFYAEVTLDPGAAAPLDADYEERAIYVVDGEIEIARLGSNRCCEQAGRTGARRRVRQRHFALRVEVGGVLTGETRVGVEKRDLMTNESMSRPLQLKT
jgi:redox-sensitive bicupin YhaK (pirin superfamily)